VSTVRQQYPGDHVCLKMQICGHAIHEVGILRRGIHNTIEISEKNTIE
jgi:hypothetical protein